MLICFTGLISDIKNIFSKKYESFYLNLKPTGTLLRITLHTIILGGYLYSMKLKRVMMIVMAFTLFFAVTTPDFADAKRGGFKSGTRSFTTTPKKSTTDSVKPNDSSRGTTSTGAAATTANRGFFSGGGLMKGLMIGGIAGMLFGGMFAGMGAFGNIIGLAINLLAIYLVFMLVMSFIRSRQQRRKFQERDDRY